MAAALPVLAGLGCTPDVANRDVPCPFGTCSPFKASNFQAAAVVIGQPNFLTGSAPATPSAATLNFNEGSPFFDGTNLYVGDGNSNRVLGFAGLPAANGASASFVVGQGNNFTTSGFATSATGLYSPTTVFESGGKLFVTDNANSRVLIFNSAPAGSVAADVVVGQPGFTTGTAACTQSGLSFPRAAIVAGGRLIVADANGHRIMIWNQVPTANGTNANLVLGQFSFTSCLANGGGPVNASTLQTPASVWSDGKQLIVGDWINNRVLIWRAFPTANGQGADLVLGQGSGSTAFTTNLAGGGQGGLNTPAAVESNGLQLVVADDGNNRVLLWNQIPAQNGTPPDVVLGQADFTGTLANAGGAVGANTLKTPFGLRFAGSRLLVSDAFNSRLLIFNSQ